MGRMRNERKINALESYGENAFTLSFFRVSIVGVKIMVLIGENEFTEFHCSLCWAQMVCQNI